MRVLLVHPGARWSVADVEAGLAYGLTAHGVEVVRYPLDARIDDARQWLAGRLPAPSSTDVLRYASLGVVEQALRNAVGAVVIVSAVLLHPDVIALLRGAGLRVYVLFTESPYDHEHEVRIAALVDGGWTHERASLPAFQAVNPHIGYLPHGWHPEVHGVAPPDPSVPAHDVVFVGSGFPERIAWFNAIDWTGIDLGLYGVWEGFGLADSLAPCIKSGPVDNRTATALYRRARIGLNLYRRTPRPAESLNPRAYELAACGVFTVSEARAEGAEVFGDVVPTFSTPAEAERLIRRWLAADRAAVASQLPGLVAVASWRERARLVTQALTPAPVYPAPPIPLRPWPGQEAA